MNQNPDVPSSIETSQQAKINDLVEKLETANALIEGYKLIYEWNLVKKSLPKDTRIKTVKNFYNTLLKRYGYKK